MARKRADALRTHRVALVRHRTGSNLILLEGLLDLLEGGKQSDVSGNLVRRAAYPGDGSQDIIVQLARVRLAGYQPP